MENIFVRLLKMDEHFNKIEKRWTFRSTEEIKDFFIEFETINYRNRFDKADKGGGIDTSDELVDYFKQRRNFDELEVISKRGEKSYYLVRNVNRL